MISKIRNHSGRYNKKGRSEIHPSPFPNFGLKAGQTSFPASDYTGSTDVFLAPGSGEEKGCLLT